jgi:peptidoglycan-associated lipoprotein
MVAGATLMGCSRKRQVETDDRGRTDPGTVVDMPDRGADDRNRLEEEAIAARNAALSAIGEQIYFDFDQSDLRSEAREVLNRKAEVLRDYPDIRIRIEGHADERGTVEYNLALGEKRARAVRDYLANLGVGSDRLRTASYGKERPLDATSSAAAWAANRRAHFAVSR